MNLAFWKSSERAGLAPGTLVHVGEQKVEKPLITLIDYDATHLDERRVASIAECEKVQETKTVSWINVDGIHDTDLIGDIGKRFGIHPLVLEDICNTLHRPKVEHFDDYLFVVLKMITFDEQSSALEVEQVSVILGKHFVLTFQEKPGDVFEKVRERIRKSVGRIRSERGGYLAYALVDAIVDSYYVMMEKISEKMEALDLIVLSQPTPKELQSIHRLKRVVTTLRRSIWPLREVVSALISQGSRHIDERIEPFLRDLHDHLIQITETISTFWEMLAGLLDVYLSTQGNRMNEIMKVLTIFAALFIPLTFIAGIYGMNFEFMPELRWRWGYFGALGVMSAVAASMLLYFRRKRWL